MLLASAQPDGAHYKGVELMSWLGKNQARFDSYTGPGASVQLGEAALELYSYAKSVQSSNIDRIHKANDSLAQGALAELKRGGPAIGQGRFDAITNAYLTAALRYVDPEIHQVEYAPLYFREILKGVITPVPPGWRSYVWRMTTGLGEAVAIADDTEDLMGVERVLQEFSQRFQSYGTAYGYSEFDQDADAVGVMPIIVEEGQDCVDRVERRFESVYTLGDPQFGLQGFFQYSDVPIIAVTTGYTSAAIPQLSQLTGNWLGLDLSVDANKQKIIRDIELILTTIALASKNVEQGPFTLLVSLEVYFMLASTPRSAFSDVSLLSYIMGPENVRANKLLKDIKMWPALSTASTGGTGGAGGQRVIAFTDNPRKLKALEQVKFRQNPPREKGNFSWVVPCYGRTGGIVMPKPRAMAYYDL